MTAQFIVNEKGERTSVIIPINDYEELLSQAYNHRELTDEYKAMIDEMLDKDLKDKSMFISLDDLKKEFLPKNAL